MHTKRPHTTPPIAETRSSQAGFTLIELMVVVAIIGLLAAVALPAYEGYISNSRQAKLMETYDNTARAVRQEYAKVRTSRAMGRLGVVIPETDTDWIELLNSRDSNAPGGGPAIVSGSGDSATGAIGLTTTGDFEAGSAQVVLTRPPFEDLTTPVSVVITSSSVY